MVVFKGSLDKLAKITTIAITLLFVILGCGLFLIPDYKNPLISYSVVLWLFIIYFSTYLFRPINYRIASDSVVVHRSVKDIEIKIQDIDEVRLLSKTDLAWSWRILGVGGLFGYFGNFANKKLGSMKWYLTRRDQSVLLLTKEGKKIIISPDDRQNFVEMLRTFTSTTKLPN